MATAALAIVLPVLVFVAVPDLLGRLAVVLLAGTGMLATMLQQQQHYQGQGGGDGGAGVGAALGRVGVYGGVMAVLAGLVR